MDSIMRFSDFCDYKIWVLLREACCNLFRLVSLHLHKGNQFRLNAQRVLSIAILHASITVLVKQDPWYIGITQVFIAAG